MAAGIIPVILSGGAGTRLWPLSRAARPKQFLSFNETEDGNSLSLFQQTALRCHGLPFDQRPVVVGAYEHRFLLAHDLASIEIEADILLEPEPRNTCAAIAAGCLQALTRKPQALVAVLAADHHISDKAGFMAAFRDAATDAQDGKLVAFGVRPDRAATGYGYILPGERLNRAHCVKHFIEKPQQDIAERLLAEGWLWNSGNFLFRADVFLDELARLEPAIHEAIDKAHHKARHDLGFLRLDPESFAAAPAMQVDHAVMEKTPNAAVLPVTHGWSDIGSWDGIDALIAADEAGNKITGDAVLIEASGNFVHSPDQLTALVGVHDMVVASTPDCLLVMPKSDQGKVRQLVARLHMQAHTQASQTAQIFRPWGYYEPIDKGDAYQVKRVVVAPGGTLSLQKHACRAEHWVIVAGKAEVTIGNRTRTLLPGQSAYVAQGVFHRLANRGTQPLVLIEVQTGDYLGEDDIVRLEDIYQRNLPE